MRRRGRVCAALLVVLSFSVAAGCSGADHGPAPDPSATAVWRPEPGLAWQWQLDGRVDPSADVPVYDIDAFENDRADVARLHRAGRKVICYVNVGAWEDYRPDADAFPRAVLGEPNGWHGERWLDIREISVLRPIMERRFDMCRDKGFDAVEPDLVEGYGNETGFPLTARDQLAYNRMIASIARERGLAVGLKNDLAQIPQLVDDFDFAVNEQCAEYGECARLTPFVEAGKAVFHVEYSEPARAFCPESRRLGLSSMRKRPELGVWRDPC
ncbi:putative endo alpha-1,4 polygalactosaminidase [Streptomyces ambofaciens ATCC 23877]|uniref:Putative endo alpha-1,4 polygalactosaminidase n=1 Tax=Streptomyces ambofaciens (strain ATCC 23877 / 3486 / DSM 40053 / JCM 4204 / NBRC 12836 / NRRL B-2516) TaxID=278992 RepID=A0ACV8_STRA7|nr:endo alpha-1,4 polygalactosaminidase [Streptomyces ambofaciens]AKZ60027.1 putative endo alpha-1,4 polygalactosaminidase [Streptomyces ambofaciens ATCC 23877]CAJ88313.1 putative endo alpha-1,4 polygalactosaminidase [Streptomyces ambofaciens ATCC 23877]